MTTSPRLLSRLALAVTSVTAVALVAAVPLAGAASSPVPRGWVAQIGTYDYLVQPDYQGIAPIADAIRASTDGKPTIGLGTFDDLNGELVLVGGTTYRVGTDGIPRPVSTTRSTPFLQALRFTPQASTRVPAGTECSALLAVVDDLAGTDQGMVGVRLIGTFTVLTARSVPAQSQPYSSLPEVIADQAVFPLADVRATLVGFRTGSDLLGVGAPGLHLHGLTKDRSAGGHILGCTTGDDVRMSIQRTRGVQVLARP